MEISSNDRSAPNETDPDAKNSLSGYGPREKLAEAFEELAESDLERDIVKRYKKSQDKLDRLRVERDEAQGVVDSLKGKTSLTARKKREEAQAIHLCLNKRKSEVQTNLRFWSE